MPSNDDANVVDDASFYNNIMPGLRFRPKDEELITGHLLKKLSNQPLPFNRIREVRLYDFDPQRLSEMYDLVRDGEWYFFTPRDRKYPKGRRPKRGTPGGFWRLTGSDVEIKSSNGQIVGFRASLRFHQGNSKKNTKTNWLMHEYRTDKIGKTNKAGDKKNMKLDKWVLCKVFNRRLDAAKQLNRRDQPPQLLPSPQPIVVLPQHNRRDQPTLPPLLPSPQPIVVPMQHNRMNQPPQQLPSPQPIVVPMQHNRMNWPPQPPPQPTVARLTPNNCGLAGLVNDQQLHPSQYELNLDEEERRFLDSIFFPSFS